MNKNLLLLSALSCALAMPASAREKEEASKTEATATENSASIEKKLDTENKTDNELCMDVDNLIINGWSIEAANGMADITPQSKYLTEQHNDFAIDEDDLEECGIDVIESIKFEFQIMDSSWDTIETIPVDLKTNIKLG